MTIAGDAHARHTDPETSHEAAASITLGHLRTSQRAVLGILTDHAKDGRGLTDEALGRIYYQRHRRTPDEYPMQSPSGLRTRRAELVAVGLVEDSGETVRLASGRKAVVWRVTRG